MKRKMNRRHRTLDLAVHSSIEPLEPRRFLSAGDLDLSFSEDGKQTIDLGGGVTVKAQDVAVQSDGKTVVVGNSSKGAFVVARFNLDGTLDTGFGANHTGVVLSYLGDQYTTSAASAVAIAPGGKIVVVGDTYEKSTGMSKFGVARYLPDGTPDVTFSGDGKASYFDSSFGSQANDVAIQSDGKIVVGGEDITGPLFGTTNFDFVVFRINDNGSLDGSFGDGGRRNIGFGEHEFGEAVAIDYTGNPATNPLYGTIVVGGSQADDDDSSSNILHHRFALARLTAGGSLDTRFNYTGRLTLPFGAGTNSQIHDMLIDDAGRIVAAGTVYNEATPTASDFALARFLPGGAPDTSFGFGNTGKVVTDMGGKDEAFAIAENVEGKLLVGGSSNGRDAIAKYATNGLLDGLFANNGKLLTGGGYGIAGLDVGPGRRFVAAGGTAFRTARYLDAGANVVHASAFLDPTGSETNQDPASFFVFRQEKLPYATRVYFKIGGTAAAPGGFKAFGGDYTLGGLFIPPSPLFGTTPYVDIPANQTYTVVTLTPKEDTAAEGVEHALFTILPDASYDVGTPQVATLAIKDNDGGSIAGHVFFDGNGNGIKDGGDVGMFGVTVWGDLDNDKIIDPNERSAKTDGSGNYLLPHLPAGNYVVRQKVPGGYTQSSPAGGAGHTLTLAQDQNVIGKNFGNKYATGSISGTVYNDLDGDGVKDALETGIAGRTVYIDANNNSVLDSGEKKAITNSSGVYKITGLIARTYKVREVRPSGWTQTSPLNNGAISVVLGAGQNVGGKNFFIRPTPGGTASIAGNVFHDFNRNGIKETGDTGLSGWVVYIDLDNDKVLDTHERRVLTDSAGSYIINNLAAGTYKVRVVLKSGYVQTLPGSGFGQNATLTAGQRATGKNFGADN